MSVAGSRKPTGDPLSAPQFSRWSAERDAVDAALERTPERETEARDALLDRFFELEHLILQTPSDEPRPSPPRRAPCAA